MFWFRVILHIVAVLFIVHKRVWWKMHKWATILHYHFNNLSFPFSVQYCACGTLRKSFNDMYLEHSTKALSSWFNTICKLFIFNLVTSYERRNSVMICYTTIIIMLYIQSMEECAVLCEYRKNLDMTFSKSYIFRRFSSNIIVRIYCHSYGTHFHFLG